MAPMDAEEFRKAGYQAIDQSIVPKTGHVLTKNSYRVFPDNLGEDSGSLSGTGVHEKTTPR